MTPNPNCPGVPHRPDDSLYRAAVERHAELSGKVCAKHGHYPYWDVCVRPTFWWNEFEYRPAEPLRTDAMPRGMPSPGDDYRLLLVGETIDPTDEYRVPPVLDYPEKWVPIPEGLHGVKHDGIDCHCIRRRLAPDQPKSDPWEGVIEEVHTLNDSVEADRIRDMMDAAIEEHRNGETEDWADEDEEHVKEVLANHARMKQLVKRLAAFNPPLLDSEAYQVNQIIQEAKELTDAA